MPSSRAYNELLKAGFPLEKRPFERYDTLESQDDLNALFEVLTLFKDDHGNHPVLTLNTILTNPDFDRIESGNFLEYHFETFLETYKKYYPADNTINALKHGIESNLLFPQLHGREHFNVERWMKCLADKNSDERVVFHNRMVGVPSKTEPEAGNRLMISLEYDSKDDQINQLKRLEEGTDLFENIFGFRSESYIAPVYTWYDEVEKILSENGVKYIQGGIYQQHVLSAQEIKKTKHYLGECNSHNQLYLTRNVFFEPSVSSNANIVNQSIDYINAAFFWRKPAIISTHRLNYMGKIHGHNRTQNLKLLKELLRAILRRWPDVRFVTSAELGNMIRLNSFNEISNS